MTQKAVGDYVTDITYNYANLPKTYTTKYGDTVYSSYTYAYQTDGNRISENDSVYDVTKTYTYDGVGRLTNEVISGSITQNTVYTYDKRGNRIGETVTGSENHTYVNTYDNNNRLLSSLESIGTDSYQGTKYTYDKNGNQLRKNNVICTGSSEAIVSRQVFAYTVTNRLSSYTNTTTGKTATYTYKATGMRDTKTVGGVTTNFVWNGNNMVAEKNSSGVIQNQYYYGVDGVVSCSLNGTALYYLKDGHGNVVGTSNASGVQDSYYIYDAFGNDIESDPNDTNPFGYCGEYADSESGLIYLRNRYYDTTTGRFISEDPIKDGLNWYSYCGANPVAFVDPLGLERIVVSGGMYSENDSWPYEFIETALNKIWEWKENEPYETITWIVSMAGWTDEDIDDFKSAIEPIKGINVISVDSAAELQNYINSKDINQWELSSERTDDKITKFALFSHGLQTYDGGSVELGYGFLNEEELSLDVNWIGGIFDEAFGNMSSAFYSCNTGTAGEYSFAQVWSNKTDGITWAFVGKSDYAHIHDGQNFEVRILRKINGFYHGGSWNLPIAGSTRLADGRMPSFNSFSPK